MVTIVTFFQNVISQSKSCLDRFGSKRPARRIEPATWSLGAMMLPEPEPCQVQCSTAQLQYTDAFPSKGSKLSAAKHVWKWGDTVPVRTSVSPG